MTIASRNTEPNSVAKLQIYADKGTGGAPLFFFF